MRICVYTKKINQHHDEGIANVAYDLSFKLLANNHKVLMLFSTGNGIEQADMKKVPLSSLLINRKLKSELKRFNPDLIIYVPRASASFTNFIFTKLLKWRWNIKASVLLVLQPNKFGFLSKICVRLFKPDLILSSSKKNCNSLANLGCKAQFIPLWIDCQKFTPVSLETKRKLRHKYGVDSASYAILHIGHINNNRNLLLLKVLQSKGYQVLVLGSTSTPHDNVLLEELRASGIKIYTNYLENVEEMLQLSDCYIFPTFSETASISTPLSVLEAMACNLPVVSTRFGGLVDIFPDEEKGLLYAESEQDFLIKVNYLKEHAKDGIITTRELVEKYSVEKSGEELVKILEPLVS